MELLSFLCLACTKSAVQNLHSWLFNVRMSYTSDIFVYFHFIFIFKIALKEDCERKLEGRMSCILFLVRNINLSASSKSSNVYAQQIERLLVSKKTCEFFVRAGALICFCVSDRSNFSFISTESNTRIS